MGLEWVWGLEIRDFLLMRYINLRLLTYLLTCSNLASSGEPPPASQNHFNHWTVLKQFLCLSLGLARPIIKKIDIVSHLYTLIETFIVYSFNAILLLGVPVNIHIIISGTGLLPVP